MEESVEAKNPNLAELEVDSEWFIKLNGQHFTEAKPDSEMDSKDEKVDMLVDISNN